MRVSRTDCRDLGFFREFIAGWIVVLFVLAVGLGAVSLRAPGVRGPLAPRWYDPPVAGIAAWEDEEPGPHGAHMTALPTDDNSTVRDPAPICNILAGSASYAQAPASGALAHRTGYPC